MGNNSSQVYSDDETAPQYRYHEEILREAQVRMSPLQLAAPTEPCFSDDEQFYSADEGDSSRSITPERTRPESSSGEECLSEEDDEGQLARSTKVGREATVLMPPPNSSSTPQGRTLRSQQSCGQCNVSVYQEHDSIGPEIAASAAAVDTFSPRGYVSPKRRSEIASLRRVISSQSRNSVPAKKLRLDSSVSPFRPISCSPNRRHSRAINSHSLSPGKRKSESGIDSYTPHKRSLLKDSTKRKRLGYFDSSDSEEEGMNGSASHESPKRSRISHSLKKQRRKDRKSSDSESDEERYKKSRRRKEEDSDGDEAASGGSQSGLEFASPKNKSTKGLGNPSPHKIQKVGVCDNDRGSSSGSSDGEVDTQHRMSEVKRKMRRKSSPQAKGMLSPKISPNHANSLMPTFSNRTETSNKMGAAAVRNFHGKILPLRQSNAMVDQNRQTGNIQSPGSSPLANHFKANVMDNTSQETANISRHLRQNSGAFLALQASPARSRLVRAAQPQQQENKQSSSPGNNKDMESQMSNGIVNNDGDNSKQNAEERSPFHGVVLTPPSLSSPSPVNFHSIASVSLLQGPQEVEDSTQHIAMDVENSDHNTTADSISTQLSQVSTVDTRPIARATKRQNQQGRSAAERFRNFWTTKNIKTNLKSFFSKTPPKGTMKASTIKDMDKQGNNTPDNIGIICDLSPSRPVTYLSSDGHTAQTHIQPGLQTNKTLVRSEQKRDDNTRETVPLSSSSPPGAAWRHRSLPLLSDMPDTNTASPAIRTRSRASSRIRSDQQSPHNHTGLITPKTTRATGQGLVEFLPRSSQYQVLHARLAQCLTISVSLGELAEAQAAGLVNWTDGDLTHTITSCSQAVAARAGALLRAGCSDYLENKGGPLEAPDVLTTPAGGKFHQDVEAILHVTTPSPPALSPAAAKSGRRTPKGGRALRNAENLIETDSLDAGVLVQVFANSLRFAEERLGLHSLAFPLIGSGEFPISTCLQCFHDAVIIFLGERQVSSTVTSPSLATIQLILPDASTTDLAAEHLNTQLLKTAQIHSDMVSAAAQINNKYMGESQRRSRSSVSPVEEEGRAASGRPRLKRPRL